MEIVTRGVNESIVIDQDIVVTVLEVSEEFVRLAVVNPHECPSYQEHTVFLSQEPDEAEELEHEFQLQ